MSDLRLEYRFPHELEDNPANWRTHPDGQLKALEAVIDDVGWAGVLLFNEKTNRLIDGHARKKVAKDKVPVLVGSWTEDQEKTILATLDPLAAMAEADQDALGELLHQVETESEDLQAMLDELAEQNEINLYETNGEVAEDPGADFDKAAELQEKWGTERGQLWEIVGKQTHRLMCGDCTVAEDVERVMGGERVELCIADPPYGISYDASKSTQKGIQRFDKIEGEDNLFDPSELLEYPDSILWGSNNYCHAIPPRQGQWLFWDKVTKNDLGVRIAEGEFAYHKMGTKPRCFRHLWSGAYRESESGEKSNHPHQKPIELMKWCIELTEASLLFDPFLGSGTTMVAAEQLGRRCHGIEIEPKYVAVALERMAGMGCEAKAV